MDFHENATTVEAPDAKPRRAWLLIILAAGLVLAGIIVALFSFTAQPAGTGEEIIVAVSGDQFPVSVGGDQLTSTDALLAYNTPQSKVEQECGGNIKGASVVGGKLTRDVVVVKSADAGVVCIGQGTTQKVGRVEVTARGTAKTISDSNGSLYKSPNGGVIYFRELGITSGSRIFDNLQNLLAGVLLAVGAGLSVELIARKYRRGRSSEAM